MKIKPSKTNIILLLLLIAVVVFGKNWASSNLFFGYIAKEKNNFKESITFDKIKRSYLAHIPPGYNDLSSLPLVVVLHGAGGNAEITAGMSRMNEVADKNDFIVVYPNGTGVFNEFLLSWNAGDCCNYLEPIGVDDMGFITFLIDKFVKDYNIDENRVYVAGFSNGGMMAYKMACEMTQRIAAFAPVSSSMFLSECEPSEPISAIIFHSATDDVIPYFGGEGTDFVTQFFGLNFKPVLESVNFWVDHNNCLEEEEKISDNIVYESLYTNCDNDTEVLFYASGEGGHSWPGGEKGWLFGSEPAKALHASEIIWDFFKSHPEK